MSDNNSFDRVNKYILNVIFTCVFLELFLGGSGRLVEFTSFLTLRMCLFCVYIPITLFFLIVRGYINKFIVIIVGYFLFSITIATIVAFINIKTATAGMFDDVKPLLNIFLLPYLYYSIDSVDKIKHLLKLLKISAVILAIMHLVFYCIYLQNSSIAQLTAVLSTDAEDIDKTQFFFKGDSGYVNYTGDVYLCIGFIVWDQFHRNSLFKYIILCLLFVSIVLTGTRGLILATAGAYFIKWTFLKFNYKSITYILIGSFLTVLMFLNIKDSIGDKDESDQVRYNTINQVVDRINPMSVIIGHGFGNGVPERPGHMEISYLEVFHKQGVIGLVYYFLILLVGYIMYKRCSLKNGMGFFMFIWFVYLLTFTNPYINHPLGITIISIAIISMMKLGEFEKNEQVILYKLNKG